MAPTLRERRRQERMERRAQERQRRIEAVMAWAAALLYLTLFMIAGTVDYWALCG